jgi:hypothetical protein
VRERHRASDLKAEAIERAMWEFKLKEGEKAQRRPFRAAVQQETPFALINGELRSALGPIRA